MSQAGWYPDPGGQPGMFRYWDGAAWSDDVTPTPGHSSSWTNYGSGPGIAPGSERIGFNNNPYGFQPMGAEAFHAQSAPEQRKTPVGAIIAAIAVVAAVGLVVFFAVRSGGLPAIGGPNQPAATSSQDEVCPKSNVTVTPRSHPQDGRVHGGMFSFPQQGSPWSAIQPDTRVPFGADVHEQVYPVETNYNGRGESWVASLLVGDLVAGDGFYGPKEGAEIVARCVVGLFYGDNKIDRTDLKSEQHNVDGKDGWLIQMHLSFDIKGLKCKGETATIVVASTGTSSASLYYSSIPDTTPQLTAVADKALSQLKVGL